MDDQTSPPRRRRRRAGRGVALVATVGLFLVGVVACGDDEPQAWAGFERTPTPQVGDNQLPAVEADGSETPFTFRAADGNVLLVYFGYTSCPDVCPTTLSDIRRATDDIGAKAERIDLAMITIDPEVDTPEILAGYVRSFMPEATAIRTTEDAMLRPVADAFGADYGKLEGDDGEAEVYHTGSLYAVDDQGQLILTWPFGVSTSDLQTDLTRILEERV